MKDDNTRWTPGVPKTSVLSRFGPHKQWKFPLVVLRQWICNWVINPWQMSVVCPYSRGCEVFGWRMVILMQVYHWETDQILFGLKHDWINSYFAMVGKSTTGRPRPQSSDRCSPLVCFLGTDNPPNPQTKSHRMVVIIAISAIFWCRFGCHLSFCHVVFEVVTLLPESWPQGLGAWHRLEGDGRKLTNIHDVNNSKCSFISIS